MSETKKILGIDTSNYKTSVAVTDLNGKIVADNRRLLSVEQGERGLRQSNALFQHIENLPALIDKALFGVDKNDICAVAVSSRPRPVSGSYMPCFNAGLSLAHSIGSVLDVPVYEFSHQEGHIEAVLHKSSLRTEEEFIAYHLSGGTCEMLKVRNLRISALKEKRASGNFKANGGAEEAPDTEYSIEIIGGSKDISYGQVLDRAGVAMGLSFPAGEALDKIASETYEKTNILKGIPVDGLYINLSGIDSQFRRALERDDIDEIEARLIHELFHRISMSLVRMTTNAYNETGTRKFLFVGGVSSSRFVRKFIENTLSGSNIKTVFGDPMLSQDNAVGTALLGVKKYGTETR